MELVPCVHCRRHVGVGETACPFCARPLPLQRSQLAFPSRLTRAAIFSAAAIIGCDSKQSAKPAPAPTHEPAGSAAGSDDGADELERMLDVDERTVERPVDLDAGALDAAAVAATLDAGAPVDAGIDPEIAKHKREALQRKREQLRLQRDLEQKKIRIQVNNKPYGAPPARRRLV